MKQQIEGLPTNRNDQIPTGSTISSFGKWHNSVNKGTLKSDMAQLLTELDLVGSSASVIGVSPLSDMCSSFRSVGLNEDRRSFSLTTTTLTHEMGHNLGSRHDSGEGQRDYERQ